MSTSAFARVLLGSCLLSGCLGADVDPDGEAEVALGEQSAGLLVASDTLWPAAYNIETATKAFDIPVCWENVVPTSSFARSMRAAVESTWEAHSKIDFTGWGRCSDLTFGDTIPLRQLEVIRVSNRNEHPHTQWVGFRENFNFGATVTLNSGFRDCGDGLSDADCLKAVAIHEFGHALGFSHEQIRGDDPEQCQAFEDASAGGDIELGQYDLESVMGYCAPRSITLSNGDKEGLHRLYGDPAGEWVRWGDHVTLKSAVRWTADGMRGRVVGLNGEADTQYSRWIIVDPSARADDNTAVRFGDEISLRSLDSGGFLGTNLSSIVNRVNRIDDRSIWEVQEIMTNGVSSDVNGNGIVDVAEAFRLVRRDGKSIWIPNVDLGDGIYGKFRAKSSGLDGQHSLMFQGDFNRIPVFFD